jgi:hypothetical protein
MLGFNLDCSCGIITEICKLKVIQVPTLYLPSLFKQGPQKVYTEQCAIYHFARCVSQQ